MVRTGRGHSVRGISLALNLELHRNLLVYIINSKYQSSLGVERIWRWSGGLWLCAQACHASFKILLMAPCVTPVIRATSICRRCRINNRFVGDWRRHDAHIVMTCRLSIYYSRRKNRLANILDKQCTSGDHISGVDDGRYISVLIRRNTSLILLKYEAHRSQSEAILN